MLLALVGRQGGTHRIFRSLALLLACEAHVLHAAELGERPAASLLHRQVPWRRADQREQMLEAVEGTQSHRCLAEHLRVVREPPDDIPQHVPSSARRQNGHHTRRVSDVHADQGATNLCSHISLVLELPQSTKETAHTFLQATRHDAQDMAVQSDRSAGQGVGVHLFGLRHHLDEQPRGVEGEAGSSLDNGARSVGAVLVLCRFHQDPTSCLVEDRSVWIFLQHRHQLGQARKQQHRSDQLLEAIACQVEKVPLEGHLHRGGDRGGGCDAPCQRRASPGDVAEGTEGLRVDEAVGPPLLDLILQAPNDRIDALLNVPPQLGAGTGILGVLIA
mmetsp:Transcript_84689/g.220646  ORF Transcript_84689/g.220646 Transcript_84689/m.220646 type:complete len:332 (-) Transcript_84689:669-1664(-)